jgi:hypothetical protein
MIRIKHLIKKEELGTWVDNPEIVKLEISHNECRRLKDKAKFSVLVYYRTRTDNQGDNPINSILGACNKVLEDDKVKPFLTKEEVSLLNALQNQKSFGYLKASMIVDLTTLELKYGISFGISKKIRTIVKNNYNEKI